MADLKGLKAVLTAGGIGTRLLPFSKEIPKEMAPIFTRDSGRAIIVKPVIQAIYEQLYNSGIRDFFVIVGRGKNTIEDHFTPDAGFIELLNKKGKSTRELEGFYTMLKTSNVVFVRQPEPLGFGDSVLRAKPHLNGEFLVHAGDTYMISRDDAYLNRLRAAHKRYSADATILLQEVEDPKEFGVVIGKDLGEGVVDVESAIEKPEKPISKTAIMPVYIFKSLVFNYLEKLKPGRGGEVQLTDAIASMLIEGKKVIGVKLRSDELRLDIGSPSTLIEALTLTRNHLGT